MKRAQVALLLGFALSSPLLAATSKTFDATYTATVAGIPAATKTITVWVPLPVTRDAQVVHEVRIESPYTWTRHRDKTWGNEYAVATIANPPQELNVRVHFTATRSEMTASHPFDTQASDGDIERALAANRLVTISPRLKKLSDEITAGKRDPIEQAHAIYEYLVSSMKYDKTIPGWGNGDSERACDIKAGNCTDFHSLFLSLARAKGIPARFVIGFPLTAKDGVVKGYHCWAEFWVKGKGWLPVDASEASKSSDPQVREYLFTNLDPDRVQFTIGRDLVLTPRTAEPLNYFIYPYAEADGKKVGSPAVEVHFRERDTATAAGGR